MLECLAGQRGGSRLPELAARLGTGRATTYQRLVTLIEAGWVEQLEDKQFRLTWRAMRIAHAALEQGGFGVRAEPLLAALVAEAGETASLAALEGGVPHIIQRVEADGVLRADQRIGTPLTLSESASGRVLVAFAADSVLDRLRSGTHALPGDDVIADVRARGYAMSSGRSMPEVAAIAAPVFATPGQCIAALSLVGPADRFVAAHHVVPLIRAAERISCLLEAPPTPSAMPTTSPRRHPT